MIVKAGTKNGWMLFEGERVSWKVVRDDENMCIKGRGMIFDFIDPGEPVTADGVRFEIYIDQDELSEGTAKVTIFTHDVVYILNDEGKTIERLIDN
jgi:hypothetical protein